MKRSAKSISAALAVALVAAAITQASAFNLRVPQIAIGGASLQNYLNSQGQTINVNTDQIDAQIWSTAISGNSVFTLMIEYAGNANGNTIGIYNTNEAVPTLYQVFPGSAGPGWHAMISFLSNGNLVVTLFDANSIVMGQATYLNVNKNAFGFYLQGPGGTFYSQDGRNGNVAQMVAYEGTGVGIGEWWLCFEDTANGDRDFEDAVMILESVNPVKTEPATLGKVKAIYR